MDLTQVEIKVGPEKTSFKMYKELPAAIRLTSVMHLRVDSAKPTGTTTLRHVSEQTFRLFQVWLHGQQALDDEIEQPESFSRRRELLRPA